MCLQDADSAWGGVGGSWRSSCRRRSRAWVLLSQFSGLRATPRAEWAFFPLLTHCLDSAFRSHHRSYDTGVRHGEGECACACARVRVYPSALTHGLFVMQLLSETHPIDFSSDRQQREQGHVSRPLCPGEASAWCCGVSWAGVEGLRPLSAPRQSPSSGGDPLRRRRSAS